MARDYLQTTIKFSLRDEEGNVIDNTLRMQLADSQYARVKKSLESGKFCYIEEDDDLLDVYSDIILEIGLLYDDMDVDFWDAVEGISYPLEMQEGKKDELERFERMSKTVDDARGIKAFKI